MTELPVIIVNVQRGGPSTGLPTKTEQSDLLQAMFGRNGDSPVVVLAPRSPADCFRISFEAVRLAVRYMTPVFVMSDGFVANGSEPWRIPTEKDLPDIHVEFATDPETFAPYGRDPETLSRPWAIPGTPGLEHRIGGLEKADVSGMVSYDLENHQRMTELRMEKIEGIAKDIPEQEVLGAPEGDLLVVSWGGTYGAVTCAVEDSIADGLAVSGIHLRYLNPMPRNVGDIVKRFKRVLVPELNTGHLAFLLRAKYLVDAVSFSKVKGRPFSIREVRDKIHEMLQ